MEKMVTGDLESQESNNVGTNGSSLVATTILHPMVCNLAFAASKKAQNRVLKQAATEQPMTTRLRRNNFHILSSIDDHNTAPFSTLVHVPLETQAGNKN